MAQLSRPFQVALVAVVLLVGVWLFALQGHSASSSGSASTPPVTPAAPSVPSASAQAPSPTPVAPAHVYHGPVPGLHGLSRDINKARGAVATSQRQAQELEAKSRQASAETPPTHTAVAPSVAAAPSAARVAKAPSTLHKQSAAPRPGASTTTPSGQRAVEADLNKGDVVLLLFWNPHGSDDVAVRRAVQAVRNTGHRVAVQEASASKVAQFGSVTRGVQVFATPTLFVINPHGQTIVLTGLQDSFSIGQAVEEARHS